MAALMIGFISLHLRGCILKMLCGTGEASGAHSALAWRSGHRQAVRFPKADRFQGSEMAVRSFGNGVMSLAL